MLIIFTDLQFYLDLFIVQIAPVYLMSCIKQGMGLLEILLYKQSFRSNRHLHKVDFCILLIFLAFPSLSIVIHCCHPSFEMMFQLVKLVYDYSLC